MTTNAEASPRQHRLAAAWEHIRLEYAGDLDAIVATFGNSARYIDEPWGISHVGAEEVHAHYARLAKALPDLRIEIEREHAGDDGVVLELRVSGTHLGPWRGLPATGRRVSFPACVVYTFDDDGKIGADKRAELFCNGDDAPAGEVRWVCDLAFVVDDAGNADADAADGLVG